MSATSAAEPRHKFIWNGSLVYEWDQTLSDVNLYVPVPSGTRAKDVYCEITTDAIKIGIHKTPPYLSERFCDKVITSECIWTLEDGVMNVSLQKTNTGEVWRGAFESHVLDATAFEADKKRLLLERFQNEHAGFDFSGADVSGETPDPRTFLKNSD